MTWHSHERERVGKTGPRLCIGRVEVDGFLKGLRSFEKVVTLLSLQGISTTDVKKLCLRNLGVFLCKLLAIGFVQTCRDLVDDPTRNVFLQVDQIRFVN